MAKHLFGEAVLVTLEDGLKLERSRGQGEL